MWLFLSVPERVDLDRLVEGKGKDQLLITIRLEELRTFQGRSIVNPYIAQQRQGLMTHHLHEDNQNRGVHHLRWGTRCLGHWQMYSTQSFPATVSVSIYHIINMHLDSRLSISIPAHSFIMFFDLCFQSRIISSLHLVNRRTLPVFASIRLDYVQTYAELLRWSDQQAERISW